MLYIFLTVWYMYIKSEDTKMKAQISDLEDMFGPLAMDWDVTVQKA